MVSASCSASLVAWLAIVKMDYDYDAAEAALVEADERFEGMKTRMRTELPRLHADLGAFNTNVFHPSPGFNI